ncbi:MAG: sigma-70 family RNA polymerase sigma factor [Planctomycetes bacterium]|nr:sigma-70 family RNA polymerase sigma factor [Planctomycetota bacterium]
MTPDDHALFEAARAGDQGAVERLIERYQPRLHAFVRLRLGGRVRAREASVDVVQSVCRELLAAAPGFEFRGEERFRDWLFTAALNKIRDKQRFHGRGKRDVAREQDVDDGSIVQAASYLTPSIDAIGRETAEALAGALAELSEEHREVITLARIVQLPHAVIAESMGRSEAAVRQLLVRALLHLSQCLKRRGITLP